MSNSKPPNFPERASSESPRVREEMADRLRSFHQQHVQQLGQSEMLKVYCRALSNWILNPNTSAYQIAMLHDELSLIARSEDLEDWEL